MAAKEYTRAEARKILTDNYESISKTVSYLVAGLEVGKFDYLRKQLNVVNKRIDSLEIQIRSVGKVGFGAAQIAGFFLSPMIGNLLVQPLFQAFTNRFAAGLTLQNMGHRAFSKSKYHEFSKAYLSKLSARASAVRKTDFDLSKSNPDVFQILFGKPTPDALGGALNDSAQKIIDFSEAYVKNLGSISDVRIKQDSRSDAINSLLVDTQVELDLLKEKLKTKFEQTEALLEGDESKKIKSVEINGFLAEVEQWSVEQKAAEHQISHSEFGLTVVRSVSRFLLIAFIGDTDLGVLHLHKGAYTFERSRDVPKEVIDSLLEQLPDERNPYIYQVAQNRYPAYDAVKLAEVVAKAIASTSGQTAKWLHPDAQWMSLEDRDRQMAPISLYDEAAQMLVSEFPIMRSKLELVSQGVVDGLNIVAGQTKPDK